MSKGKAPAHQKRKPMHTQSATSVVNKEPGFTYRVVNDSEGRIDQFLAAGYVMANDNSASGENRSESASKMGSIQRLVVNKGRDADTKHAVVMKIPTELYEEDQRDKQKILDRSVETFDPQGIKAASHTYGAGLTQETK